MTSHTNVKIERRELKDGRISLRLIFSPRYYNVRTRKTIRTENLGLFLIAKPKNETEIQTRNISRFLEMSDVSQINNRSFHRVIASQKNYSFSSLRRNIAKPFLKRNVRIETKLFLIDKITLNRASYSTKLLIQGIS